MGGAIAGQHPPPRSGKHTCAPLTPGLLLSSLPDGQADSALLGALDAEAFLELHVRLRRERLFVKDTVASVSQLYGELNGLTADLMQKLFLSRRVSWLMHLLRFNKLSFADWVVCHRQLSELEGVEFTPSYEVYDSSADAYGRLLDSLRGEPRLLAKLLSAYDTLTSK